MNRRWPADAEITVPHRVVYLAYCLSADPVALILCGVYRTWEAAVTAAGDRGHVEEYEVQE